MRAIVQAGYVSADVLHLAEIGRPVAGDGEVLLRVHAAGLDRGTWHLMAGQPYLIRLVSGLRAPKNPVPGLDVAGAVVAVGADVTGFAVGEEVFGIGHGSFAEYARAGPAKLVRKPAGLTFAQAAVVAVSGLTALQGLRDAGRLRPGQHVLITGASGGVGTFAVQIAKALGAQVTGVGNTAKPDLETLAQLIEAGQLTPVIGKTYPLHQAPDAMRDLLAGHARGKLVITMTDAG